MGNFIFLIFKPPLKVKCFNDIWKEVEVTEVIEIIFKMNLFIRGILGHFVEKYLGSFFKQIYQTFNLFSISYKPKRIKARVNYVSFAKKNIKRFYLYFISFTEIKKYQKDL